MFSRRLVLTVLAVLVASCSGKPNVDELLAKGDKFVEQGQLVEAILQYRMAEQAEPMRGDVRNKLADAYLLQRDGRNALAAATRAADLLPNDPKVQVKAGTLLLAARQYEDAKARADKALALDAKSVDALVLKGNALAGLKDLEGALSEYQEALALNPLVDQIYANIGTIQFVSGQPKEAEETFKKAIEVAPKSTNARLALAGFYWASRRFSDSERIIKEALSIDPTDVAANRALGSYYIALGKPAEAEQYFEAIAKKVNTDQAQIGLADYYLAMRKIDRAIAILDPLTKKPGSFEAATLRLAALEVTQNNNKARALEMVRQILIKSPKYTAARVFELRVNLIDGKPDQVLTLANALIKDEPNSSAAAEAYQAVGMIEASRDRNEDAIKAFDEALRIEPRSLPALLGLAQIHLQALDPGKTEQYARQALQVQSNNPMARALIVRADLLRGNNAKAAAELASLEKEFPTAPPVMNLSAARELTAGRLDAARAAYVRTLAASPDNLEALEGLITIDLRSNRQKEAVDRVEAAVKRAAPSANLYMIAGRVNSAAGNQARAEELFKLAIEKEPARLATYLGLGQFYMAQKRLADARDQFQTLVSKNPRSVPMNTMLGMLLEAQKDIAGAEKQYIQTLAIDPEAPIAANNLAWLYVSTNRNLDKALELAQVAVRKMPDEPHVNDTLGWAYYRKAMYSQAVRHLELSTSKDATDPSVHYHLGMAYFQVGDLEKSKRSLQKALSINSVFEGAEEAQKTLAKIGRVP